MPVAAKMTEHIRRTQEGQGPSPFQKHTAELLLAVQALLSAPPAPPEPSEQSEGGGGGSAGAPLSYAATLGHATKVEAALADEPGAWSAWLEAVLDARLLSPRCRVAATLVSGSPAARAAGDGAGGNDGEEAAAEAAAASAAARDVCAIRLAHVLGAKHVDLLHDFATTLHPGALQAVLAHIEATQPAEGGEAAGPSADTERAADGGESERWWKRAQATAAPKKAEAAAPATAVDLFGAGPSTRSGYQSATSLGRAQTVHARAKGKKSYKGSTAFRQTPPKPVAEEASSGSPTQPAAAPTPADGAAGHQASPPAAPSPASTADVAASPISAEVAAKAFDKASPHDAIWSHFPIRPEPPVPPKSPLTDAAQQAWAAATTFGGAAPVPAAGAGLFAAAPAAKAGLFGTPVNPFASSPAPAKPALFGGGGGGGAFKVGDKVKALPGIESQSIPSRIIGQIGTVMSCGASLGVKFFASQSLFGSSESTWMTSPQYVERVGGAPAPAATPAAAATGGGDASEGCFDLSASKGGNSIKLSDSDATATIGARESWAVTKQALSTSGAFSFVLLNDNEDDEGSCFGIVPERHIGSLPDRQHDSSAIDGGAYFRSYEGKVADCSGGGSTDHQFKLHVGGKVRIEVDLAKGTATFFVNGVQHPHVAQGITGPVRGFVFRYGSSRDVEAKIEEVRDDAKPSGGGGVDVPEVATAEDIRKVLGRIHVGATVDAAAVAAVQTKLGLVFTKLVSLQRKGGSGGDLASLAALKDAVTAWLPGKLAKHAVSEIDKAGSQAGAAALLLDTALVSVALKAQMPAASEEVVRALAALLEYLTAELAELAGNAARDASGAIAITPWHLQEAIARDDELRKLDAALEAVGKEVAAKATATALAVGGGGGGEASAAAVSVARVPNLSGMPLGGAACAALALLGLFASSSGSSSSGGGGGAPAADDEQPPHVEGAGGAPLAVGAFAVAQPDATLKDWGPAMRGHVLCREWGAVELLVGAEPAGMHLGCAAFAPGGAGAGAGAAGGVAAAEAALEMAGGQAFPPGVLFHVGTQGGKRDFSNPHGKEAGDVVCSASSLDRASGGVETLAQLSQSANLFSGAAALGELVTEDKPGSWVAIDLGAGRALCLEAYAVRCGKQSAGKLRHWQLQASEDGWPGSWVTLRRHANDATLKTERHAQALFAIDPVLVAGRAFRHFRLLQTGPPSGSMAGEPSATNSLRIAGLELYGGLDTAATRRQAATRRAAHARGIGALCEVLAFDASAGVACVAHPARPLVIICRAAALLPQPQHAAARALTRVARRRLLLRSQAAQRAVRLVQIAARFFLRLRALRKRRVQAQAARLLEKSSSNFAQIRQREAIRHVEEMIASLRLSGDADGMAMAALASALEHAAAEGAAAAPSVRNAAALVARPPRARGAPARLGEAAPQPRRPRPPRRLRRRWLRRRHHQGRRLLALLRRGLVGGRRAAAAAAEAVVHTRHVGAAGGGEAQGGQARAGAACGARRRRVQVGGCGRHARRRARQPRRRRAGGRGGGGGGGGRRAALRALSRVRPAQPRQGRGVGRREELRGAHRRAAHRLRPAAAARAGAARPRRRPQHARRRRRARRQGRRRAAGAAVGGDARVPRALRAAGAAAGAGRRRAAVAAATRDASTRRLAAGRHARAGVRRHRGDPRVARVAARVVAP